MAEGSGKEEKGQTEVTEKAPMDDLDFSGEIAGLNTGWDPGAPHPFTSHRGVLRGPLVAAKRGLRWIMRPLSSLLFVRQTEFNGRVARLLSFAVEHVQSLENRFEELLLEHRELEGRHRELYRRHHEVSLEVDRLRDRMERLKIEAAPASAPSKAADVAGVESSGLPAASYLSFEDRHRGTREEIREAQREYLPYFSGVGSVLDVGCGRGEFLELLGETGVDAYGIDLSGEMIELCRKRNLKVFQGDASSHLAGLAEASLGGIFAAQVVEHMTADELSEFVSLASSRLAPGGVFIAETVNPACLSTFAGAFYLDLTHTSPVHPEALRFLLDESGFGNVEILWRSPFPPEMKLEKLDAYYRLQRFETSFLDTVNRNFNQLNELIYGYQDYAAVARK